jgi:hypothetical protein
VESSLLDGNLFKINIQPAQTGLPKLENMFKNSEMGKLLVNDVIQNMVSSRN